MNREETIIEMMPIAKNLAKHYGYLNDEDLIQDAVVGIIQGVDWCMTQDKDWSVSEIGKVCNTFARRCILHTLRDRNNEQNCEDVDDYIESIDMPTDFEFHIMLLSSLTDKELLVYRRLVMGYDYQTIQDELNLSKTEVYRRAKAVKDKIKLLGKYI